MGVKGGPRTAGRRYGPELRLEAFRAYLDLRSCAKVSEAVDVRLSTVEKWSSSEDWVRRAEAFDAEERVRIDKEEHSARARRRRQARAGLGKVLSLVERKLDLAAKALEEAEKKKKPRSKDDLSPAELEKLAKILETTIDLEPPEELGGPGGAVEEEGPEETAASTLGSLRVSSAVRSRLGSRKEGGSSGATE